MADLPNVLAARYASGPMADIWSPERKVVLERQLWVAVMRAQHDLGLDLSVEVIDDHVAVIDKVDLASIEARERVTRHDVKARIEEFSALAGHEHPRRDDVARPHRERGAAPGAGRARARPRPDGRRARPPGRAGRGARHPRHDRPQPQRARPGHHDGQALRQRRRGAAPGPAARRGAARALPAARHQGPGRHAAGHARPARRPGRGRPARGGGGRATSASRRRSPTSVRCTPARSTSTSWPRSCRRPRRRPASPPPSA